MNGVLRAIGWVGLAAATAQLIAMSVAASELGFVEVTQIFYEPNEGLHLQTMTYSTYSGTDPGLELRLMGDRNCVCGDGECVNRNVMYALGVRTWVEDRTDYRGMRAIGRYGTGPYVVDSLRVEVHFDSSGAFRRGGRAEVEYEMDREDLAKKVIECAIANARRARPSVSSLAMLFVDSPELKSLSRVYPVRKP